MDAVWVKSRNDLTLCVKSRILALDSSQYVDSTILRRVCVKSRNGRDLCVKTRKGK